MSPTAECRTLHLQRIAKAYTSSACQRLALSGRPSMSRLRYSSFANTIRCPNATVVVITSSAECDKLPRRCQHHKPSGSHDVASRTLVRTNMPSSTLLQSNGRDIETSVTSDRYDASAMVLSYTDMTQSMHEHPQTYKNDPHPS